MSLGSVGADGVWVATQAVPLRLWWRDCSDRHYLCQTVRGFIINQSIGSDGWQALAWCLGLLIAFVSLSIWAYAERTARYTCRRTGQGQLSSRP